MRTIPSYFICNLIINIVSKAKKLGEQKSKKKYLHRFKNKINMRSLVKI